MIQLVKNVILIIYYLLMERPVILNQVLLTVKALVQLNVCNVAKILLLIKIFIKNKFSM